MVKVPRLMETWEVLVVRSVVVVSPVVDVDGSEAPAVMVSAGRMTAALERATAVKVRKAMEMRPKAATRVRLRGDTPVRIGVG